MRPFPFAGFVALAILFGLDRADAAESAEPPTVFDGRTLSGWEVIGCEAVVEDGAILIKSGNGLVQTDRKFRNFVLTLQWKALKPQAWDSGIYFRYRDVPAGRPWPNRYQVNLRQGMEGELVGIAGGKCEVPARVGDWNQLELTVRGQSASLKANGKPAWKVEGLEEQEGFIALQAEVPGGGQFLFREIRITPLPSEDATNRVP